MELEKQVVSLELSKRLKELGVKQESLFYWSISNPETGKSKEEVALLKNIEPMLTQQEWGEGFSSYSSFTVAELGEMLPMELKNRNGKYDGKYFETYRMAFKKWIVEYCQGKKVIAHIMGDTEANARAKMLIYLLENNLCQNNK